MLQHVENFVSIINPLNNEYENAAINRNVHVTLITYDGSYPYVAKTSVNLL